MVWSIFQKIGNAFSSVAHSIGDAISGGYQDTKNIISGAGKTIQTQLNNVHDEINKVTDGVEHVATGVLDTGKNIIEHTEDKFSSIVSMPLLLIAGGLGLFMVMNGRGITDTAQVAIQKY